jgi:hypothetical protein
VRLPDVHLLLMALRGGALLRDDAAHLGGVFVIVLVAERLLLAEQRVALLALGEDLRD